MNDTYVTVHGNVASITRTGVSAQGATYHTFRVASTPRRPSPNGWQDGPTSWFSVTCWGQLAEHVASCVRVGDPVVVHGSLELREWKEGDRSGREAELRASSVGHDLRRGTSLFRRERRAVPERVEEPAGAAAAAPYDDAGEPRTARAEADAA